MPRDVSTLLHLYEPLDLVIALLSKENPDTERFHLINKAIMADVLGETPINPPPSTLSPEANEVLHAILALYSCRNRFEIFPHMFRRCPWRGRISKEDHLKSTFYLLAHETYILEERLKSYLNAIDALAASMKVAIDIKGIRKFLLQTHKRAFGSIVQMRGRHVHEEDVTPRDIKRVGLLRSLKMSKEPEYERLYKVALKDATSAWSKHSEVATDSSDKIIETAFRLTKPVWTTLSRVD
jgi:hypothetical protein